jgi:hypothetical protein
MEKPHVKYPLFLCDFNETLSRQIFEKYSNTKLNENPSIGNRVLPGGRMDRHEANRRFSQFCETTQNTDL